MFVNRLRLCHTCSPFSLLLLDETLVTNVMCGVLSGVISSAIANPTDVLKVQHACTRMQ